MLNFRTYTPSTHDFFDEVATLFVNLASFNAATESFSNPSSIQVPNSPDHTFNLYGRIVTASFPIHRLMHGVVRNQWPTALSLTFSPASTKQNSISNGIELQSDAICNMITQLVGTTFLKFYERNVISPKSRYPQGPKTWPSHWRFAWLLRNAIAHGDRWIINDPSFPSTSWNGVSVSPTDSGKQWFDITNYIAGGDVLLLMEELNADRSP